MDRIKRLGVSMEPELLEKLDDFVGDKGFPSRSEAIRHMVADRLSKERLKDPDEPAVGSITILYNHHQRGLTEKLTDFQHDAPAGLIISTTHIHVSEELCLEILVCKGRAREIKSLADKIAAIKGVRHGEVSMRGIGEESKHVHPHHH